MPRGGRKNRKHVNEAEQQVARSLDNLSKFQEFGVDILPKLRKMIAKADVTPEEILEFTKAYAVARVATIAFSDDDNSRALAAAKDLLDRSLGKAKERSEVEHKYSRLKDEELDALLESRLAEVADDDASDSDSAH